MLKSILGFSAMMALGLLAAAAQISGQLKEPAGAITAQVMESVYVAMSPQLSRDCSNFAYVGQGQIFLLPASGGWPVQLTSTPECKSEFAWSSDSRQLAYAAEGPEHLG